MGALPLLPMKTPALLVAALILATLPVHAADAPPVVLLWPNGAPGSEGKTSPEKVVTARNGERVITNVNVPSLTIFLPAKDKATGAGVIVMPGGGHYQLSFDSEGTYVAQWLADHGIAAFVLKNRLARTAPGATRPPEDTGPPYTVEKDEYNDVARSMRLVRSRAAEWEIDPARLGVMGFSAGGELAAMISLRYDDGKADDADPIERQGTKPAFQGLFYPGNSKAIVPVKDSPPAFLLCGGADRPDISEGLPNVYLLFKKAGVPVDLHILAGVSHGFGLRASYKDVRSEWPQMFYSWLRDQKFLAARQ